jgi:squalene synthase HpnC
MAQPCVAAELERYGPQAQPAARVSHAQAVAYCRHLARGHYENFTVASWLLPRDLVPHFCAVYAYCRWADDLADETDPAASLGLLDWWQEELEACYAGRPRHPVFVALRGTIEEFSIPIEPFERLLIAFRRDQRVTRYQSHDEVLAYCRDSADPVGRLILYLGRAHDETRGALADSICTGLQLANFCQDVARDWRRGRVYLPADGLDQADYTEAMFARGQFNDAFRQVMRAEVDRAEGYLRAGLPLVEMLPRKLRLEVALFIGGGLAILEAVRRAGYDVWLRRPTVSRAQKLAIVWRAWWATRGGRGMEARA